jgi:surfeit locus 1 family protein
MREPRSGTVRAGRPGWMFVAIAVVLAAVFARLGVWQLDRLGERRAANRRVEARLALPAEDLSAALGAGVPAADLAWRHVRVEGIWDVTHEIVIRARALRGAPGVEVVTPLMYSPDSAVLVLRGWLPAADGLSADLASATPAGADLETRIEGLALMGEPPSRIPPRHRAFEDSERLVLGSLSVEQAAEPLPFDLLPVFLLASGSEGLPGSPVPVPEPALSDGPHLSYAIQWFAFALISLAGSILYIRTRRRSTKSEGDQT